MFKDAFVRLKAKPTLSILFANDTGGGGRRIFSALLPAATLALFLTGCMLDTDRAISVSPAASWAPPESAVEPATLVRQTHVGAAPEQEAALASQPADTKGERAVAAEAKDIAALVDEALTNNPMTQKAWYNAKIAAAAQLQANSIYYPSLNVAENYQRQKIETIGFGDIGPVEVNKISQRRTTYGPMLELGYTLFTFGAQTAQAEAAREALYAANFQFNRQLQDTVLAVQEGYYALHAADSAIKAEEASLKDAQAALEAAETKNRVGLSPIQDVLKAKSNLLDEQYRLDTVRSTVEMARARLAQVLGRQDIASVRIKPPVIQAMPPEVAEQIEQLITAGLAARPDLQAAYAQVRAAENQKTAAVRALLPQVVTGFNGDLTRVKSFSGEEENYLAFIRLQWDIFDGFNKEARVIKARSELEAVKRDAKAAELAVAAEIWAQYYNFKSAREQLASGEALVSASEATYEAINTGYKSGLNSILDLLDAQRDLERARLIFIRAQTDYTTSLARLANALGELPEVPDRVAAAQ